MKREVLLNEKAREALMNGFDTVADVVGKTMGAKGGTAIISHGYGTVPIITKDGIRTADSMNLVDQFANVGGMCLRSAGNKTVVEAGDGTSQTIVLARAIIKEGYKQIKKGRQPQAIKRGMDKAVKIVVDKVKELSQEISPNDETLLSVATISANNDVELGKLIADTYKKIGKDGVLNIDVSNTIETYVKIVDGFEFNRGYQDYKFSNTDKMQVVYEKPLIFVADYDLVNIKDVVEILGKMVDTGRPIIVLAKGIEGEVLSVLLANKIKGGIKICSVKAPNTYQEECLSDVAVLTGATVISDKAGIKLTSAAMEHLGTCDKIIITGTSTTIINGAGDKAKIKERESEINVLISEATDPSVKNVHTKRLAQLTGSAGVIYVGASGEIESREKIDRVDDAVRACKSALEEGISVGGGVTLLRCIESLENVDCYNDDERAGVLVIKKALETPARQILSNAGIYHGLFVRKLLKLLGIRQESFLIRQILESEHEIGYNVKTMQLENLKEVGVIDPSKVIRVALQNANSVAGSIITSDSLIVDILEK
jgi:chaperonin GroEL